MSAHSIAVDSLLALTAVGCWIGVIGMIRMRNAHQALHYLGVPAILGGGAVTLAVLVQTGWSQATWKCGILFLLLLASNSVGTHAAARAFRQREKGHWEPLPDDSEIEFLGGKPRK